MSEEQLAKLAQNPVANQIRVPFQYSARPGRFVLKCSSSFQSSFVVEGTRRSFVECQPSEVLPDHSGAGLNSKPSCYSETRKGHCHWNQISKFTRLITGGKWWRRERDSNPMQTLYQINNLLNRKTILSPPIPVSPHSWH